MAQVKYLALMMGLSVFTLSGCGVAAANTSAPARSSTAAVPSSATPTSSTPASVPPNTTALTLGSLTLRVPSSWVTGSSTTVVPGVKAVHAASGADNKVTIHQLKPVDGNVFILLPQLPKPSGLTSNAENNSPYFTESEQTTSGVIYGTLSDLTPSGTEYVVTLTMPSDQAQKAQSILQSITAPSPATVSQAVNLLKSKPHPPQALPLVTAKSGSHQWILAGGQPATAQEGWFLFRSQNNGSQWSLIGHTSGLTSGPPFPNTVGSPTMLFWNPQDGVIVQPSYASPALKVFWTRNGGNSWNATTVRYSHQGNVFQAPKVTRGANGILTITVALNATTTIQFTSQDGGSSWTETK